MTRNKPVTPDQVRNSPVFASFSPAAREAVARNAARTAVCKCGATFELPATRGRPPKACLPCRALASAPRAETGVFATVDVKCPCGKTFKRPVKRGRPQTKCETCRVAVLVDTTALSAVEAVAEPVVDDKVYTFKPGDLVRLKVGAYPTDPDGRDSFVVRYAKLGDDGVTVRYYECFGGDPTDPEGVRMARSFAPQKLRPENRKNVLTHRHRPA